MKAADLRDKSVEDLDELRKSLQSEVFQSRMKNFTNRLDDTSAIRKAKRDYARVVTLLRETELGVKRGAAAAVASAAPSVGGEAEAKASKPAKSKKSAKKSEAK